MEFFLLIIFLTALTPVGYKAVNRALPQIKGNIKERKTLSRIEKRKLEIEASKTNHQRQLREERQKHNKDLAEFDRSIKEIERPAILKMVEQRALTAGPGKDRDSREYWVSEVKLLTNDYNHIKAMIDGDEVTESDLAILRDLVDRMKDAKGHIDRINTKEAELKRRQAELDDAPRDVLAMLEVMNNPLSSGVDQVQALCTFVGISFSYSDVMSGKITTNKLLDLADKKMVRLQESGDFDGRLQKEALKRAKASSHPEKLLELWGVRESFNNWVQNVD